MDWYASAVEKGGMHPCSMGNSAERGRKRKVDDECDQAGAPCSNATSVVVTGAWLTPEKKARTVLEVCDMNCERGMGPTLITVADPARTLGANVLMLVGDGEGFRVLERP
jgi:hypothetical protein